MSNSTMRDVNSEESDDEVVRHDAPLDSLGTDDEDDSDLVGHGFEDDDDVPDSVGGAGATGDLMGGPDRASGDAVGGRDARDAELLSDDE
jgi:hypothetical protein